MVPGSVGALFFSRVLCCAALLGAGAPIPLGLLLLTKAKRNENDAGRFMRFGQDLSSDLPALSNFQEIKEQLLLALTCRDRDCTMTKVSDFD